MAPETSWRSLRSAPILPEPKSAKRYAPLGFGDTVLPISAEEVADCLGIVGESPPFCDLAG